MPQKAEKFRSEPERVPRRRSRRGLIRARLILSLILFAIAAIGFAKNRADLLALAAAYMLSTLFLSMLPAGVFRKKRVRALSIVLDVVAISVLVFFTGGITSIAFLFYFFPIVSAARYLRQWWWCLALGVITFLAYGISSGTFIGIDFLARGAAFIGVGVAAFNVVRLRDRAEDHLTTSLQKIQGQILNDAPIDTVLRSILNAAMKVTSSDAGAVVILDGTAIIASDSRG